MLQFCSLSLLHQARTASCPSAAAWHVPRRSRSTRVSQPGLTAPEGLRAAERSSTRGSTGREPASLHGHIEGDKPSSTDLHSSTYPPAEDSSHCSWWSWKPGFDLAFHPQAPRLASQLLPKRLPRTVPEGFVYFYSGGSGRGLHGSGNRSCAAKLNTEAPGSKPSRFRTHSDKVAERHHLPPASPLPPQRRERQHPPRALLGSTKGPMEGGAGPCPPGQAELRTAGPCNWGRTHPAIPAPPGAHCALVWGSFSHQPARFNCLVSHGICCHLMQSAPLSPDCDDALSLAVLPLVPGSPSGSLEQHLSFLKGKHFSTPAWLLIK